MGGGVEVEVGMATPMGVGMGVGGVGGEGGGCGSLLAGCRDWTAAGPAALSTVCRVLHSLANTAVAVICESLTAHSKG